VKGTPGRGLIALAVVTVNLAAPAAADAAVRFASPTGDNATSDCTSQSPGPNGPCTLTRAVEVVAQANDEVVVLPGDYNETDPLVPPVAIDLHGAIGQPRPTIDYSGNDSAVDVDVPGVVVRDLRIAHSGGPGGAALDIQASSTAERVVATSSANIACLPALGALIRDSICHSTADGEAAVRFFTSTDISTATLFNVTAVASVGDSNAIDLQVFDVGMQTLNATNVIASGSGTAADVSAVNNAAGSVTINLDHSNYDTENEPGVTTTITNPGSGTNQLAPPQFLDAPTGGFHQLATSPTVDAGVAGAGLGTQDIDGEARVQGAAPDIGADELTVAPLPPPAGDNFPPDTGIHKGPKKKTFKRHIKFEFGGSEPGVTFACQLDDNGWEPCTSPKKYRGLKRGKHVFAVRAVDAAGNLDPTPADRHWRITKKPKSKPQSPTSKSEASSTLPARRYSTSTTSLRR
jgi:hypothetical protein